MNGTLSRHAPGVQTTGFTLGRLRARYAVLALVAEREESRDAVVSRCARREMSRLEKEIMAETAYLGMARCHH